MSNIVLKNNNGEIINTKIPRYEKAKKSTDKNGWIIYEYTTHKEYIKKLSYVSNFSANFWGLNTGVTELPEGMLELGDNILTTSCVTSDGVIMVCAGYCSKRKKLQLNFHNRSSVDINNVTVSAEFKITQYK